MVGLDAAGKTTILYKLKLGEIVTTIPTIGMSFRSRLSAPRRTALHDTPRCIFWSYVMEWTTYCMDTTDI